MWSWFLPNPVVPDDPSEQSGGEQGGGATRTATVVLVEHDRDTRDRLRLWLQLDGHRVAEAADEAEALKIISQEPPDIVLLDLSGSGMSWMKFFLGLNGLRPRPDVRVIGMTPCTASAAGAEGIRFFACDVLQKPVRQDDLRCAVAGILKEMSAGSPDKGRPACRRHLFECL